VPYFSLSMPRGNQLVRQWQLLQLIDQRAGIAVDDAARKLDCTVRTIWRDLSALQRAGFPSMTTRAPTAAAPSGSSRSSSRSACRSSSLAETAALVMSPDFLRPAGRALTPYSW
jgi:DeoR/GlpR family transcriptional regulator of sugar metabolism